jgi:hypothetical protein
MVPWFTLIIIRIGALYIIVVTIVNIIAIGYDSIVYVSLDSNMAHALWYDRFIPSHPSNYKCTVAQMALNDCAHNG